MPVYDHKCNTCGGGVELTISFAEYKEMEEEFGRTEGGNVRFPCPNEGCDGWSERDYSRGVASFTVKGGYKYQTKAYRADAEHEWMKQEIENTKGTLLGERDSSMKNDYNTQRPYAGYTLDEKGAEDMGFKRVNSEEAKARAEVSKKTSGDAVAKVEKGRKSKIIED
jgi:hypothetical protein